MDCSLKTFPFLCAHPRQCSLTHAHTLRSCVALGFAQCKFPQSVNESTACGFCSGKGSMARQVLDFHKPINPLSRRQCGTEGAELTQELGERLASSVHSASDA